MEELKCPNCGADLKVVLQATTVTIPAPEVAENVATPEQAEVPAVTPEAEVPADAPVSTDEQNA